MSIIMNPNKECMWNILYEAEQLPNNPSARLFLPQLREHIPEFDKDVIEITSCYLIQQGYLKGKFTGNKLTYISAITEKGQEFIS